MEKLLLKQKKKSRLIILLSSIFFFVAGSVSSISLYNHFFGGMYDEETKAFQQAYNIIKNEWYYGSEEITKEYLEDGIEGLVNGRVTNDLSRIDPYLTYYPYSEETPTYGIGVEVLVDSYGFPIYDGYYYVSKVYGFSSAHGVLEEGDLISKVNGESIRYKNSSELEIKGEKDTPVTISYIRDGEEYTKTLYRKESVEHSVTRQLNPEYAILTIDGFTTSATGMKGTAELAEEYLKEIKKENINNLLIDLRDNPGGYISAFKSLSELFIPKNKSLGTYIDKSQTVIETPKTNRDNNFEFEEIIILINEKSASASESFAACMKDNLDNVTIVGTNSYGKGIAQKTTTLSNGSSLRYTYAEYFRPNGNKVHKVGVAPDTIITLDSYSTLNRDAFMVDGNLDMEAYGKSGVVHHNEKEAAYQKQLNAALAMLG